MAPVTKLLNAALSLLLLTPALAAPLDTTPVNAGEVFYTGVNVPQPSEYKRAQASPPEQPMLIYKVAPGVYDPSVAAEPLDPSTLSAEEYTAYLNECLGPFIPEDQIPDDDEEAAAEIAALPPAKPWPFPLQKRSASCNIIPLERQRYTAEDLRCPAPVQPVLDYVPNYRVPPPYPGVPVRSDYHEWARKKPAADYERVQRRRKLHKYPNKPYFETEEEEKAAGRGRVWKRDAMLGGL